MTELVLASQSPRRAALLNQLGVSFRQQPADIDERQLSGEPVEDYVARLAWEKSAVVAAQLDEHTAVLAADTTVVLDGQVLGKPEDHFDALAMLARLSGREHQVLTAVCVRLGAQVEEAVSDSRVQFRSLSREQCEAYLLTDEPWDKAGAYGIQGLAGAFVETLQGSYTGIVGLPLSETWDLLQRVGVTTGLDGKATAVSEELLVNVSPLETRVAVVDHGILQDIHIERAATRGIVGNIYLGKVARVLPGMQAAFVEIGEERTSFIHVNDIYPLSEDGLEIRGRNAEDVREHLREGQDVLVQVIKEPLGNKGARLTTQLSLSSRYLVYMPRTQHTGISQQIEDDDERSRLRSLLDEAVAALDMSGGYILRTAAEGVGREELESDLRFLKRLWSVVMRRASEQAAPARLFEDWQLYQRSVRDLARPGLERIRVDSEEAFGRLHDFCEDYVPELAPLLEHYRGTRPLFDLYSVEDEIGRALERNVPLKSGGYLIIDQTEAMSTIDVNTGAFVGRSNQEETVYKTNLEAVTALARQIRLRNLGGIIIIDFIDMRDPEHRRQVYRALEKAMARDRARTVITGVSELGLVEMTRKRTRDSLAHVLCEDCPVCGGRGALKSAQTVCYEIFRDILREARAYDADILVVRASQEVVDRLLDEDSATVADLEALSGKSLQFQVEPMYSREQFDIILL